MTDAGFDTGSADFGASSDFTGSTDGYDFSIDAGDAMADFNTSSADSGTSSDFTDSPDNYDFSTDAGDVAADFDTSSVNSGISRDFTDGYDFSTAAGNVAVDSIALSTIESETESDAIDDLAESEAVADEVDASTKESLAPIDILEVDASDVEGGAGEVEDDAEASLVPVDTMKASPQDVERDAGEVKDVTEVSFAPIDELTIDSIKDEGDEDEPTTEMALAPIDTLELNALTAEPEATEPSDDLNEDAASAGVNMLDNTLTPLDNEPVNAVNVVDGNQSASLDNVPSSETSVTGSDNRADSESDAITQSDDNISIISGDGVTNGVVETGSTDTAGIDNEDVSPNGLTPSNETTTSSSDTTISAGVPLSDGDNQIGGDSPGDSPIVGNISTSHSGDDNLPELIAAGGGDVPPDDSRPSLTAASDSDVSPDASPPSFTTSSDISLGDSPLDFPAASDDNTLSDNGNDSRLTNREASEQAVVAGVESAPEQGASMFESSSALEQPPTQAVHSTGALEHEINAMSVGALEKDDAVEQTPEQEKHSTEHTEEPQLQEPVSATTSKPEVTESATSQTDKTVAEETVLSVQEIQEPEKQVYTYPRHEKGAELEESYKEYLEKNDNYIVIPTHDRVTTPGFDIVYYDKSTGKLVITEEKNWGREGHESYVNNISAWNNAHWNENLGALKEIIDSSDLPEDEIDQIFTAIADGRVEQEVVGGEYTKFSDKTLEKYDIARWIKQDPEFGSFKIVNSKTTKTDEEHHASSH